MIAAVALVAVILLVAFFLIPRGPKYGIFFLVNLEEENEVVLDSKDSTFMKKCLFRCRASKESFVE